MNSTRNMHKIGKETLVDVYLGTYTGNAIPNAKVTALWRVTRSAPPSTPQPSGPETMHGEMSDAVMVSEIFQTCTDVEKAR
jgi:hypothetical protein